MGISKVLKSVYVIASFSRKNIKKYGSLDSTDGTDFQLVLIQLWSKMAAIKMSVPNNALIYELLLQEWIFSSLSPEY